MKEVLSFVRGRSLGSGRPFQSYDQIVWIELNAFRLHLMMASGLTIAFLGNPGLSPEQQRELIIF